MTERTFRELDGSERSIPGPPAVLLCGFSVPEAEEVRVLLDEAQTGTERLVLCTEGMLRRPLQEVLEVSIHEEPVPPDRLPRVILLSGMTEQQIHSFLDAFRVSGLPRPIFATTTDSNLRRNLRDLLLDLLNEHRSLTGSR